MTKQKCSGGFTKMMNTTVRTRQLSLRDRGLLLLLLSFPPDWHFSVAGLCTFNALDGKDAITASLKRLEQEGYLIRERQRSGNGKFTGSSWMVSDLPFAKSNAANPMPNSPERVVPVQAKPALAEAPVTKTIYNKNGYHKDCINKACVPREARECAHFVAPRVEEIESFCSQEQLSIDSQKFVDNYAAKGWKIGSTPVHDWKALVRKWAREDQERASAQPRHSGIVEINGEQYLYKGGQYYVPGGCGVAVDPYAKDDLPF